MEKKEAHIVVYELGNTVAGFIEEMIKLGLTLRKLEIHISPDSSGYVEIQLMKHPPVGK